MTLTARPPIPPQGTHLGYGWRDTLSSPLRSLSLDSRLGKRVRTSGRREFDGVGHFGVL